ncbi:hypothetical protein BGX21_005019 [Mortierella sp. AD011]|nr:hypothetical protein BGX21_005019 [Mortierella sp. AD011]
MDSFKEFAIKDTHSHPDFNRMYSCFLGYVGRQRSNGVSDASSKPDLEQCRKDYDEILLQGSISVSRTTASNVVNHAIQSHGARNQVPPNIKGGDVTCQEEWPQNLDGIHLSLYRFIETKLHHPLPLSKISEKDMFVAMSGIVNTRMDGARKVFGDEIVEKVRDLCLRPHISEPSQKLLDILAPLQEAYRSGGLDELLYKVEEGVGIEAKERREKRSHDQLKGRIMDAVRHIAIKSPTKDMSEAELVSVWSYVINALAGHTLSLRSGELASKATKWQRLLLQQELDHDSGTATYGRKLDLQCRSEELELNNSEFKANGRSKEQVELQYRKNLRINQSMMLYLKHHIGIGLEDLEVLALDVHGFTAVLFSLRYHDNVFVSDLATKHLLRLPDSTVSWKQFLSGSTLSVLLAYVEHLKHLIERIEEHTLLQEQQERIEDRRTPERELRCIGEFSFFSPAKKQCRDGNQSSNQTQTDSEAEETDVENQGPLEDPFMQHTFSLV